MVRQLATSSDTLIVVARAGFQLKSLPLHPSPLPSKDKELVEEDVPDMDDKGCEGEEELLTFSGQAAIFVSDGTACRERWERLMRMLALT